MNKLALFILILCFCSCQKECLQKLGAQAEQRIELGNIESLRIEGRIKVTLREDSLAFIKLIGQKAFFENIQVEENAETLKVYLDQSCGLLNHPDQIPEIELSLPQLNHIYFAATAELNCIDTLRRDSFKIECWNSSGNIDLLLNTALLRCENHIGPSDIRISGKSDLNYIFSGDIGFLFLEGLEASGVYLNHSGYGEVHIKAKTLLEAELNASGDLFYYGSPQSLKLVENDIGEAVLR